VADLTTTITRLFELREAEKAAAEVQDLTAWTRAHDEFDQLARELVDRICADGLTEAEKDVALGQAVEFAAYVERQAKGAMMDAAKRFLSLPYAQDLAARIASSDKHRRALQRIVAKPECGCLPCTGECRIGSEAERLEHVLDIAEEALRA